MAAGVVLYGLAWVSFGLGHSLLAAAGGRQWLVARFGAGHRVAYNIIATLHLASVWLAGRALLGDQPAFILPDGVPLALHSLALGGVVFGIWALKFYDGSRLLGLHQLRAPASASEDEPLRLDGPHRWVRHPLYLAAFMILWGRALDPAGVATAMFGSVYLILGTWHEEQGLMRLYGAQYAAYRAVVPAFLPWKGRVWKA